MPFEQLGKMIDNLESQMDNIEDENPDQDSTKNPKWMKLWKKSVTLAAQRYQIAFPKSKLEINEEGTQFKVLS